MENRPSMVESNEARQKFAGAKAISSDMFFGREADAEVDHSAVLTLVQLWLYLLHFAQILLCSLPV